jgi:molybdopterin converting factor small subunit
MEILVRLDEPAWRLVGQRNFSIHLDREAATVADAIGELTRRYAGLDTELRGQTGDYVPYALFLNDEQVRWSEIEHTRISEQDRLRVLLPITGG